MMPDNDSYFLPGSVRRAIAQRKATGPSEREVIVPRRPAFDAESADRPALIAEAALRGVVVTRADGRSDLEPRVEDYRRALSEAP
jgi:hypothetical protein